jgi:hypothetical protein
VRVLLVRLAVLRDDHTADWASFVAFSVYFYEKEGLTGVGILGVVRMGAAVAAIPLASGILDRYPRQRLLLAIQLARGTALGLAAVVLALGGAPLARLRDRCADRVLRGVRTTPSREVAVGASYVLCRSRFGAIAWSWLDQRPRSLGSAVANSVTLSEPSLSGCASLVSCSTGRVDTWERVSVDEVIERVESEGGDARAKLRRLSALAASSDEP